VVRLCNNNPYTLCIKDVFEGTSYLEQRGPYRRNTIYVKQGLWYGDIGAHHFLKIESNNFE
jgi:hypothetical protein